MFGIYRFSLSMLVVLAHLWTNLTNWTGIYAVFAFYMLSGYLMCRVLNTKYGFTQTGIIAYASNRALRIYPPYLAVLLIAIITVAAFPITATNLNPALDYPTNLTGWVHNFIIFGINGDYQRLIPPAWSLDIELSFYLLIPVIARSKKISILAFVTSSIATIALIATDAPFTDRYYSLAGCSWPFTIGVLIGLYKNKIKLPGITIPISITITTLYIIYSGDIWEEPGKWGFYLSTLLFTLVLINLANIKINNIPTILRKSDKYLGSLAYPIFLCHWHVSTILLAACPTLLQPQSAALFFASFTPIIILSQLTHRFVEKPIEKFRSLIRNRATNG